MFMLSSSFLILFPVGCVKLNLNRYIYVHEESQLYLHNADVIARSQYSYIKISYNIQNIFGTQCQCKVISVSSANNKIPFYPLQNCIRLVVYDNLRIRLWERDMVNLVQYVFWRDSKIFKNWDRMCVFPWLLSFRFTTKILLVKATNVFSC